MNGDLFHFKTNLSTRFVDSSLTATMRVSEAEEVPIIKKEEPKTLDDDIKERLTNLEGLLGVDGTKNDVLIRLKILEDKMIRIEELYPQVAVRVFKYEQEAPKGTGRLSKAPDLFTDNNAAAQGNSQSAKIEEMKQRLSELRSALNK
mgnify:CR=1 FL=1